MPLVLLEAAAAGLPIVASDVQGLREFVGNNGVLVHNPSPETFAAELNTLLSNPQALTALSAASRAWAADFTWAKLVKHIESLYEEVRTSLDDH
jgi:glycosyltransferase involved in cell wall biosynthesis